MAGISTKSIYGLAAMFELSKHYGGPHIQIKEISAKLGIPQNYLEQLLSMLRRAGLVESVRGAGGGYKLACDPSGVRCCDVIEVLDGDVWRVENPLADKALELFWSERSEMVKGVYALSLKELLEYEEKAVANLVYYI